jgi:hypothetical protein
MVGQTFNVNIAVPDTEYSFKVPANTKYLLIKARDLNVDLKLAFTEGLSGTTYITIHAGSTKTMTGVTSSTMSDVILYFQANSTTVVEIETWR